MVFTAAPEPDIFGSVARFGEGHANRFVEEGVKRSVRVRTRCRVYVGTHNAATCGTPWQRWKVA